MDFITSDKTLKVGDLVLCNIHKGEYVYKIVEIKRRFIDKTFLMYNAYAGGRIGDEYNPEVTIQAIANFSMRSNPKIRKIIKVLDAAWVEKIDPKYFLTYIKKLNDMITELWP